MSRIGSPESEQLKLKPGTPVTFLIEVDRFRVRYLGSRDGNCAATLNSPLSAEASVVNSPSSRQWRRTYATNVKGAPYGSLRSVAPMMASVEELHSNGALTMSPNWPYMPAFQCGGRGGGGGPGGEGLGAEGGEGGGRGGDPGGAAGGSGGGSGISSPS